MALNTVTVTWDENNPTLAGLRGTISFTLSSRLDDATDGLSVNPIQQTYPIAQGTTKPLVANDNANALPTGSFYTISVQPDNGSPYTFQAQLNAANGATQKLSALTKLSSPATPAPYLPLTQIASTGTAGFALQNATPTILSWTAPNDGAMHRVLVLGQVRVITAETGGAVSVTFTYPDGSAVPTPGVLAANLGTGFHSLTTNEFLIAPGSTITLAQSSALTAGSAVVWAELWAS